MTENEMSFFVIFARSVVDFRFNDNSPQRSQGSQRRKPTGTRILQAQPTKQAAAVLPP
jgi:hypothetical protein